MNLNFDGAFRALGLSEPGDTIFRYDDTNPEAESQEYIDSQADNVAWLGWKPSKVTHSSDYFEELYNLAVELIKRGKAFVCHQTKADMEVSRDIARSRKGDPNSPWRDRSVEENLAEFDAMRRGMYAEGEATLRMKIDMHHVNPCMWDPVAYRIKYVPHPHAGDAWCIYPSYDFTHCLVDSLEHIDYSLCTLEFEPRRDSYYWLLEALDLWRPHVWEFSRLNLTRTMLSKRKIMKLVNTGAVRGWDDPRLATIMGLRRRGYSPEALNAFCRDVGVTRTDNIIHMHRLEHFVRADMDATARRGMAVLNPLKIELTNWPANGTDFVDASGVCWIEGLPNFPKNPERGVHRVALTNVVYVEHDDFRMEDEKGFFGLAPGKTVGLRGAGLVTVTDVVADSDGKPVLLRAEYSHERTMKPKGNLHWVSPSVPGRPPMEAEVRLYDYLFTTDVPGSTGDWESEINPDSERVVTAYIDASLESATVGAPYQFERVGFFVADQDSVTKADAAGARPRLVFNLTVSLRGSK
jgi:glutaminyl-tRNA synthetase